MNTVTPTFTSCQADAGRLPFQVAADTLDEAWSWLCRSRENAPDHADIWALRHRWAQTRDALIAQLVSGEYRLTPMLITGRGRKKKEAQALWSARDALVLKWVALIIAPQLAIPARCEHVKGHGGGPSSVARMTRSLVEHRWGWVCRTDVRGYYGSINKQNLLACVFRQIQQPVLRDLITQYVHYTVEYGGEFHTPEKGIARGCSLSPLMGALYLAQMDTYFSEQSGMYYARYMDDVVILAKTRWQLRRYVRALNQFFNAGDVEQHPDKTFIGRTTRGFDWMGAQMGEHGVEGIAQRAKVSHRERLRRLYERFSRRPAEGRMRMSAYRRRWKIWAMAILILGGSQSVFAGSTLKFATRVFPSAFAPDQTISNNSATASTWTSPVAGPGGGGSWFANFSDAMLKLPWTITGAGPNSDVLSATSVEITTSGTCTMEYGQVVGTVTYPLAGTYTPSLDSSNGPWFRKDSVPSGRYKSGNVPAGDGPPWRFSSIPTVDSSGYTWYSPTADVGIRSIGSGCSISGIKATYPKQAAGNTYRVTLRQGLIVLSDYHTSSSNSYGAVLPINIDGSDSNETFVIGNLPNCTSLNVTNKAMNLGSVTRPVGGGGTEISIPTSKTNQFSLSCTGASSYPVGALATVYGGTGATPVNSDSSKLAFSDPGLYLSLIAPDSWPSGVIPGDGQTAGKALTFGTISAPVPLWAWSLPATTTIATNPVTLTPKVFLSGSNWSTSYGDKKVTVRFTTTIQ
ncbi:reverse transcriptase domain-containing protein [Enterobacter cloacae complex sp. ESBL7]|uniref:reverse transcriptase domain-containing protein n=1 Tax=Enterobacter cloacae complex sp. ESBL7 TaxID=3163325 RepID=UPI00356246BC